MHVKTPRRKKIFIHGYYDVENFGDRLLAELIKKRLSELLPGADTLIPVEKRKTRLAWAARFMRCDYTVWGGGGYLSDSGIRGWGNKPLFKYLLPYWALALARKRYSILCPGVGPVVTKLGALQIKRVVEGAEYAYVRDDESAEILRGIGVKREVRVASDFVTTLKLADIPADDVTTADKLLGGCLNEKTLGIHLESLYRVSEKIFFDIIEAVIRGVAGTGVVLVFIVDHDATMQAVYSQVADRFRDGDVKIVCLPKLSVWETVAVLGKITAVITSKLHVGITAWTLGAEVYSLWTHVKTERFYRQVGRPDKQIRYADYQLKLKGWLDEIVDGSKAHDAEQLEIRTSVAEKSESALRLICRSITDSC